MESPKDFWVLRPEHSRIAVHLGLPVNPIEWTIVQLTQIASAPDWEDGIAFNQRVAQEAGVAATDVHALVNHILAVQGLLEIAEENIIFP